MKSMGFAMLLFTVLAFISCKKDEKEVSERYKLLTSVVWTSDSLLVNGMDASGPGQLLEKFKGDIKFNEDGTGTFGDYSGTWQFSLDETELIIFSESLSFPLTTKIEELSDSSLKITTGFPNPLNPEDEMKIRMTFKVK